MIQNSAYGNPLLDGASAYPDLYIQHQSVDKADGPQTINNNIANYTNRNSGFHHRYQSCIASQPASPIVAQDSYIRPDVEKPTEDDTPMGFLQLSHNVQIKTEQPTAYSMGQTDVPNIHDMAENVGVSDMATPRSESSEEKLLSIDQKPYEALQQSITYVQTPAAAGEEREREEEEIGAKALSKKDQRRPMNAFLIFCKRHRTMLKDRFPEENRAISIKLGKWWRVLTTEQKKPFQQLSKEYKNKYLLLNPNFRWCKQTTVPVTTPLPAPDNLAPSAIYGPALAVVSAEPISAVQDNRESLEAAESLVQLAQGTPLLSTFRLADESNMGSLNELCVAPNVGGSRAENKEQTWKQQKVTQAVGKEFTVPTLPSTSGCALTEPIAGEGRSPARATRSCKGKKYKELMSRMYPSASAPQTKRSPSTKMQKDQQKAPKTNSTPTGALLSSSTALPEPNSRAIDALMMELDAKISDLPAMNVVEFCFLLSNEKKRKKSFTKLVAQKLHRDREVSHTSTAASEVVMQSCYSNTVVNQPNATIAQPASSSVTGCARPVMYSAPAKIVGCRKRKAPKECITRNLQPSVVERQINEPDRSKVDSTCQMNRAGPPLNNLPTFH
uniref:HMG box domain-containing protein n=1 Tax=Anopheles christyi TaxID=43041 RepID=A0A182K2C5_9DIPT